MNDALGKTTTTALADATREDIELICAYDRICLDGLPGRVIAHLELLRGEHGGMSVDRLDHCLQTATRAARAGESDEYVLCALLHDIGDTLASYNHAELAAAILRPFVNKDLAWIVEHHADFQTYYFFPHLGVDRDVRSEYASHELYDLTLTFCDVYDQVSFDPAYRSMPLDEFMPLVTDLMSRPATTPRATWCRGRSQGSPARPSEQPIAATRTSAAQPTPSVAGDADQLGAGPVEVALRPERARCRGVDDRTDHTDVRPAAADLRRPGDVVEPDARVDC